MAKQTINLGNADKGNGDPIRTAFNKVNQNFTELYTALGLNENGLNLGSFEFTDNTITTTDSSNVIIDQAVVITSDLEVQGSITLNGVPIELLVEDFDGGAASTVYNNELTLNGGGA
jgi:hypothetical protein